MSEVHTFKIDDRYGVPDRLIKEFINDCEKRLGLIRIFMHDVQTPTANLLTVIVVPDELPINVSVRTEGLLLDNKA